MYQLRRRWLYQMKKDCPVCDGRGYYWTAESDEDLLNCAACGGLGYFVTDEYEGGLSEFGAKKIDGSI
jgi:hypothetical protein